MAKTDWIQLTIQQSEDGTYEGYEALTDEHITGTAREVLEWAIGTLEELQVRLRD